MKIALLVIIGLYSCIIIGMQEQEFICVTTSNKETCLLLLWKIKESNTLHKLLLEAEQKKTDRNNDVFRSITISSVSLEEMRAYRSALNQPPAGFKEYFDSLTGKEKQTLITAAGKRSVKTAEDKQWVMIDKKLNAKALTAQLIMASSIDCDIIDRHIAPYIDLTPFINSLASHIINCNIDNKEIPFSRAVDDSYSIINNDYGICSSIPSSQVNNFCYQNILTLPSFTCDNDATYKEEYLQQRETENDSFISYIITPDVPLLSHQNINPCKKHLWLSADATLTFVLELKHPYSIDQCRFSPNGAFLAIISNHQRWKESFRVEHQNESCLSLTSLGTSPDRSDFFDILYKRDDIGNNVSLSFNSTSTLLAAATTQGVYIFTMKGKLKQHLIDETYRCVEDMTWNSDDTTLCALIQKNNTESLSSKFVVYDMNNYCIKNSIPIVYGYAYDFCRLRPNIIIIPINIEPLALLKPDTTLLSKPIEELQNNFNWQLYDQSNSGFLLVNAATGAIISFLQNPTKDLADTLFAMNLNETLLVTAQTKQTEPTDTMLYTIASQKGTVINNTVSNISGVGFSPDGRSVIISSDMNHLFLHLYDQETAQALTWLKDKPSLMQRYALHRLHKSKNIELYSQSAPCQALESLPEKIRMCIQK